ncbi:PspC domain-containing protein [Luteibacter sp. CQ10]|uniref:PspC domain-containing protein n=1 Tax=Luteibacter sp. CQ10 TaxID=2805821 RepID=UPI0034A57EB0
MKTVVTLSVRGRAFQVEEDGYRKLREYLDSLAPTDRDATERVLAGRLAACVDATKTVVTSTEIDAILRDVAATPSAAATPPLREEGRRLYRIREGQWLAGLCNGLAVYSKVDVAWMRSIFIILGVFSGGALVILYLIAIFVVPVADDPRAATQTRDAG